MGGEVVATSGDADVAVVVEVMVQSDGRCRGRSGLYHEALALRLQFECLLGSACEGLKYHLANHKRKAASYQLVHAVVCGCLATYAESAGCQYNNFLFPFGDAVQRALYCGYKALVLLLQGTSSEATRRL